MSFPSISCSLFTSGLNVHQRTRARSLPSIQCGLSERTRQGVRHREIDSDFTLFRQYPLVHECQNRQCALPAVFPSGSMLCPVTTS